MSQPKNQLQVQRKTVSDLLGRYAGQIEQALPSFLTAEKMIRVALTAASKNPKLYECTQTTLMGSILTSAQLGLLPDGVLGEAYLIPYKNNKAGVYECQFIVGYQGLVKLAMRSEKIKSINTVAVREGDEFEYERGLEEKLIHKPIADPDAEITHFYAVMRYLNEGHAFEVMTAKEVQFIRDKSPNYAYAKDKSKTIWGKHFEEMGKKTVLRRLMKMAPLTTETQRAANLDELGDAGASQGIASEVIDANMPDLSEKAQEEFQEAEVMEADERKTEAKDQKQEATVSAAEEALKNAGGKK